MPLGSALAEEIALAVELVADAAMPGVDGFAVCERIRSGGNATPVLFLTAHRDVDTFDRALAVGADDFLSKPVKPQLLYDCLLKWLTVREASPHA